MTFTQITTAGFVVCFGGFLLFALITGKLWTEEVAPHWGALVERKKRPVLFWTLWLFFAGIFGVIGWGLVRDNILQ